MPYRAFSTKELVEECAGSDNLQAWQEFVRRFQPLIAVVVLRTCRRWGSVSHSVIDDLVQETYIKICGDRCRLLREFDWQNPDAIYGFIKVLAANLVHDHFKSQYSEKRGGGRVVSDLDEPTAAAAISDPRYSTGAMERKILLQQIERLIDQMANGPTQQRDKLIFLLYYQQGMTAQDIASLPAVSLSIKGVESTILRMTRFVRQQLAEKPRAARV
jgi:RNA polymerase sigma-70 factor (ECF subfamily)